MSSIELEDLARSSLGLSEGQKSQFITATKSKQPDTERAAAQGFASWLLGITASKPFVF